MTQENFHHITGRCQPHNVFSSDWSQYYADDFADSLLPDAGVLKGESFRFYDGAELTPLHNRFVKHLLPLTTDGKALRLTMFSYPQGVKAEEKKTCIVPDRDEVCVFFEIDEKDSIKVSMCSGEIFKANILSYAAQKMRKTPTLAIESKPFVTSLSDFQDYFRNEISHFKMFCFLGELMDIDMEAVGETSNPKIHITNVVACNSKPCGSKSKNSQGSRRSQIRVDFKINSEDVAQYEVSVLREEEKLYEMVYVPEVVIEGREGQYTPKSCFPAGVQTVHWDCTEMMDILAGTERITVRIVAKDSDGNTSLSERVVSPRGMFENPRENNYIIVLDDADNEQTIYGDDIIRRQERFIERIPKKVYDNLSDTHKLILHLPEIMVKLGWLHGGLCQIHWLEGSGKSLKFPYDFFMSEERVEDFDVKNLREYFKGIRYLSKYDTNNGGNSQNENNQFLYNTERNAVKEALNAFIEDIALRDHDGSIGDFLKFYKEKNEYDAAKNNPEKQKEYMNETFFQSFDIGDQDGNMDDIGAALGRYSLRCYYQGYLHKDTQTNQWSLEIEKVVCRFFDDFSFEDDTKTLSKPKTWYSQPLGYWKYDTENPKYPKKVTPSDSELKKWFRLYNSDFRDLKAILRDNKKQEFCSDFFIFSNQQIIDDEFIKKTIHIF